MKPGTAEALVMTPEMALDPYAVYRELRERTPFAIARERRGPDGASEETLFWPLMRYADVYAALKDHETFSSTNHGGGGPPLVLITDDPPRHTRFRKLVSRTFTPRRIAEVEPWIKETSDRLFDALPAGEFDFVPAYTVPLPVQVISRILGIPGEDYQRFKRWTDSLLAFVDTESDAEAKLGDMREMAEYFGRMAIERREQGAEDLITTIVQTETEDGRLSDGEAVGFCILLLVAGNETTTNLMGNMVNHLAHDPGLFARVKADRTLVEPFIEEMVRYESPVQVLFRHTVKEAHLPSGGVIPAGQSVGIFFGAANRDPDGWPEPDTFRLDRNLKDHVGFGHGIHYCLGSPLARAEARITLENLLDRYAAIEPGAAPAIRQTNAPIVYGFRQLPVVLRR